MATSRSRQALAFLLGATLVGGVLGFTADRLVARDRLCPRWGNVQEMRVRFGDELELNAQQRAAVDTILDAKRHQIAALVKPVRPQIDSVTDQASVKIKALLTPEQQATFDAMQREMKASQAKYDK
jgi:Spy/CpxP family protein refolding chaperone